MSINPCKPTPVKSVHTTITSLQLPPASPAARTHALGVTSPFELHLVSSLVVHYFARLVRSLQGCDFSPLGFTIIVLHECFSGFLL
mmetsp:Transcript_108202/g.150996  ORF Transcript_108202/g.150996 Transcript_108202/m.150996 type:complete len:86 (-) Transcript_108202:358-615(-)